MNKAKKPEIRFKGFSDKWKKYKLGEVTTSYSGGTPAVGITEYYNGRIPFIRSAEVNRNYTELFITQKGLDNSSAKLVSKGDILYALYGATSGEVGRARLNGAINQAILAIKPLIGYDPEYLTQWLRKSKRNIIETYLQGGQGNLSGAIVKKLAIDFPSYEEQQVIGIYLQKFDEAIMRRQSKLEKLQAVKTSMLEKMFPKDGADVPEVRFKGFTAAWKRAQLENYLSVSNEKNTNDTYNKTDVLSVSGDYGIINQIKFQGRSFAGVSVSNYGIVHTGDIVYTKSPLNSNPYGIIKTNKGKTGIVSTLYAVYHTKTNTFPDFVQVYFEQHARMNNYMHPLVNKGAKNDMKVSSENALKGTVIFPDYREQKAISAFFARLDHLIALQQQELDKLQSIKKALLEKMFV